MTPFPFTKKKFSGLSDQGKNRWLIRWLSSVYQTLLTNRIEPEFLTAFHGEYSRVMEWNGQKTALPPDTRDIRPWLEYISNAIHTIRTAAGEVPKDHQLLPRATHLDSPLESRKRQCMEYHLALDGLRSLFNVGSIFRTCDAAGVKSIILGSTPGHSHPTVRKTSMGASDWMPHQETSDLAGVLMKKKEVGLMVIGVETIPGSKNFHDFAWPKAGIIVLGNEEYGISSHLLAICDAVVHIPMYGRKNSLNVAAAAAVILFHLAGTLKNFGMP